MEIWNSNQGYYIGDKKSIFLAGPTTRNSEKGTKWRSDCFEYFAQSDVCLFVPEPMDIYQVGGYRNIIPYWPKFEVQVDWELHHLSRANIILFWVHREFPDHPALTTNVEFGYWIRDSRTIYGRPEWAEKCRYLDYLWGYRKKKHPIFTNLHQMCQYILNLI